MLVRKTEYRSEFYTHCHWLRNAAHKTVKTRCSVVSWTIFIRIDDMTIISNLSILYMQLYAPSYDYCISYFKFAGA
jgi:hypothetical protein